MVPTALRPAPARHRRPRRRAVLAGASLVLLGAATLGATAFAGDGTAGTGCGSEPLDVRAAPEVAPAVETAATFLDCTRVVVTVAEPADVAKQLAAGEPAFDVWVPDSSSWLTGAQRADAVSIAWSPVVLAVPAGSGALGHAATVEEVALAAADDGVGVSTPDPARSAPAQAAVAMLAETLGRTPAQRGALATLLRDGLTTSDADVRPTTEQQFWAGNQAGDDSVHAVSTGRAMDYPYVVTADRPGARRDAAVLREVLVGSVGEAVLEGLGFRSVAGEAMALSAADSRSALGLLATLSKPSRVLALVDVSGSMDQPVPGTGLTRLQLARQAILEGLSLFPRGTVAGLWRFSSDLTPSTNYEQVAPMATLTPAARRTLADAVGGLTAVPLGGTGLYDSVLAAVRHVRAGYDPDAVNSVVVLSDGRNEAASAHGITEQALLRALRAEADPQRPVVVVTVAYGPDSDTAALRAISDATGGSLHVARDPRDLPVIFRDAIGGRVAGSGTPSARTAQ
ncbi:MAG TPA: substrate-binding domain-containing protein [Marmoricola sp.]|nr:substrate-binding domain-containing protein [Marmoricola sp.]